MLKLLDGPCKGTYFGKRVPVYLRGVIDQNTGEKDVLYQIDNTPRISEEVHVYKRQAGEDGFRWVHVHGKKTHEFYVAGEYRYLPEVSGDMLRDNTAWHTWVVAQTYGSSKG